MTKTMRKSRAAVLIPLYKESMTWSEEFSFNRTLSVLKKHDIYVVCPEMLRDSLTSLKKYNNMSFEVLFFSDTFFSDIHGYNQLLMSEFFYRRFDCYEYVLIVQTDALALSDQLDEWCDRDYSYIGAPWFKGLTRPSLPLSFLGVGNGGFSLRKVSDFIMILSSPEYNPPAKGKVFLRPSEVFRLFSVARLCMEFSCSFPPVYFNLNEDLFWGMVVPGRCKRFTVPKPEDALQFAFEVSPRYLFELNRGQLPFGCHAWERYDWQFWRDTLRNAGIDMPQMEC